MPLSVDPAPPIPEDRARHAIAVVSIAALALLFTGRRAPHSPPFLSACWALDAWLALPLAGALVVEARRRSARLVAMLALLVALAPFAFRTWAPQGRARIADAPATVLAAAAVSLLLTLAAGHRGGLRLSDWGLGLGRWRWWLPRTLALGLGAWALGLGAAALIPEIADFYPDYAPARSDHAILLATLAMNALAMNALVMVGWEYLFRGALLFGLARSAGPLFAILCQALPFFLAHRGGPDAELIASFVGAGLLAAFCWRARSYWPAPLLHWSINAAVQVGGALF